MDTQNETVELVNATSKTDQEIMWKRWAKRLDGRILQIETWLSGIRKGIIALIFLCFLILIFNIDWKVMINDIKDDSQEYWKIVAVIVISFCIIVWVCKISCRILSTWLKDI